MIRKWQAFGNFRSLIRWFTTSLFQLGFRRKVVGHQCHISLLAQRSLTRSGQEIRFDLHASYIGQSREVTYARRGAFAPENCLLPCKIYLKTSGTTEISSISLCDLGTRYCNQNLIALTEFVIHSLSMDTLPNSFTSTYLSNLKLNQGEPRTQLT